MTFQPGTAVPKTQVELSISCRKLRDRDTFSKSDPMCVLFVKEFGTSRNVEFGRTEQIKNCLNPDFAKRFAIDYYFEESQKLMFEIYDVDTKSLQLNQQDFLGRCEITLGEIVGAPGSKVHRQLVGLPGALGSIIIAAEEISSSKEAAVIQFKGIKLDKKDFLGKSDPFLQIFRTNEDNTQTLAYRTEVINNNLNPVWRPFKLKLQQLCGNDENRPIKIECYDYDNDGGHDLIGICQVTLSQLKKGQASFDLINLKKKEKKKDYKNSGQLYVMQCGIIEEATFLDYIRGGCQINFTVAVDFTASNGNPTQPTSLHYIHPYAPNPYMVALKSVGEICQDYDTDKMFPALGFGAKLPPDGRVSHEFFLNFSPTDPNCHRIDGVLAAYRHSLLNVQLYGPTNFSPVINHVARFAAASHNQRDGSHYFVLLIITDGVISDMDQTIQAIISASSLPMSIIIVGVGNDPFEAMEILDSDKGRLSAHGRVAERDIVQFVPFRNYISAADSNAGNFLTSQAKLAKDVLAEIPQQLVGYMEKYGIKAKPPVAVNVEAFQPTVSQSANDLVAPPGEQIPPQFLPQQQPPQHGLPYQPTPPQTNPSAPAPPYAGAAYNQPYAAGAPYQPPSGYPMPSGGPQQANYPMPGGPQQGPPSYYQQPGYPGQGSMPAPPYNYSK